MSKRIEFQNLEFWLRGSLKSFESIRVEDGIWVDEFSVNESVEVVDAKGSWGLPLLTELDADFMEPGSEEVYNLKKGQEAMLRGGFGSVLLSPTNQPVLDDAALAEWYNSRIEKLDIDINLAGAISRGGEMKVLSEIYEMKSEGVDYLSSGLVELPKISFLRSLMEYSTGVCKRLFIYPFAKEFAGPHNIHEGWIAERFGLRGIPEEAETVGVYKVLSLAKLTQCKIHLLHITAVKSIEIIEEFRSEGVDVTFDVSLMNILHSVEDLKDELKTVFHVTPPLRPLEWKRALIKKMKSGSVNALSCVHRPILSENKVEFFEASYPGIVGLETAFAASLVMGFSLSEVLKLWVNGPKKVLGQDYNEFEKGKKIEFFLFSPDTEKVWKRKDFVGSVSNSPFLNVSLKGVVLGSFKNSSYHLA
jgi:dihydroorotase